MLVTLKVYDHWEGKLRAPADAIDQILEKLSVNQIEGAFVRKTLEEGMGLNVGCAGLEPVTPGLKVSEEIYPDFHDF